MNKPLLHKGWMRVILFLLAGIILSMVINLLALYVTKEANQSTTQEPLRILLQAIISNLGFIIALMVMCYFIDKKNLYQLGFQWKGYSNDAWIGFFTGILLLTAGTLILLASQSIFFTGLQFNLSYLLKSVLLFFVVAFIEEIIFRGYILHNLLQDFHKWIALLISSLLFALMHAANPSVTFFSVCNIFIAGCLLGINYIYTRNLWFAIFLHFSWNFFQGPVLGYSVSGIELKGLLEQTNTGNNLLTGGVFGFEGSLLAPVFQLMAIFVFIRIFSKKL